MTEIITSMNNYSRSNFKAKFKDVNNKKQQPEKNNKYIDKSEKSDKKISTTKKIAIGSGLALVGAVALDLMTNKGKNTKKLIDGLKNTMKNLKPKPDVIISGQPKPPRINSSANFIEDAVIISETLNNPSKILEGAKAII